MLEVAHRPIWFSLDSRPKRRDATRLLPYSQYAVQRPTTKINFFRRFPPEIRALILVAAFGDRTIHMDMEWSSQPRSADGNATHGRRGTAGGRTKPPITSAKKEKSAGWQWSSCVCHRFPSGGEGLSYGRYRNWRCGPSREPEADTCMQGMGACNGRRVGRRLDESQVGAMGWLLSCRQAYNEGLKVLYCTNTFHFGTPVLLKGMHDFLSQPRLDQIQSLELVWAKEVRLQDGFTGLESSSSSPRDANPIFRNLCILRISFPNLVYGQIDPVRDYEDSEAAARKINQWTLPALDKLLRRLVPASTDVTISVPRWDWFAVMDRHLVAAQGEEKSRPHRADVEGLKIWRETPETDGQRGFWIHCPVQHVSLQQPNGYDWERHARYNLGSEKYRHL